MIRWRQVRRSKNTKKRNWLRANRTTTNQGFEPRRRHQLTGKVSTFIRWPRFWIQTSAYVNPEVHHCVNDVAAPPILWVMSPTRAKSGNIAGHLHSRMPALSNASDYLPPKSVKDVSNEANLSFLPPRHYCFLYLRRELPAFLVERGETRPETETC